MTSETSGSLKANGHGGKRIGAGRPKSRSKTPQVPSTIRTSKIHKARFSNLCLREKKSQTFFLEKWIDEEFNKPK